MKYKFAVMSVEEMSDADPFSGKRMMRDRENTVFEVEISADEMVEMMQHLWHIADKRKQVKS